MEETVGFWWESSMHETTRRFEVLFSQMWVDLRILANFVEMSKETFREDVS